MLEPFFSIIIPVYNGDGVFQVCLQSVVESDFVDWELIVVDDGSLDKSGEVAQQWGARVLTMPRRSGPAAARNLGAKEASGRYLFFTDSDCQLHPDTLRRAAGIFNSYPYLDALIGSYDDAPDASNFISQYKNLFHHYIHQTSRSEARTFWTGCGAIKRELFLQIGGFDAKRYPRPSIEDIELGYRLTQQGGKIRLSPNVQIKHFKQWRWHTVLHSDIFDRALPWAQLLREQGTVTADLNLQWSHRLSALLVLILISNIIISFIYPRLRPFSLIWVAALTMLNRALYAFFWKQQGLLFTIGAVLWHWFYYFYSGIAFALNMFCSAKR